MAVVKRIVCLANSRKPGGRCVAGIEIDDEWQRVGWIRPVSDREDQAVADYEQQYQDKSLPCILDIVEVPLKKAQPHEHQQENWLLDGTQRWIKAGAASWEDLTQWGDYPKRLWINGYHTGPGLNNKIPNAVASELNSSLCLFKVEILMVHVIMHWS